VEALSLRCVATSCVLTAATVAAFSKGPPALLRQAYPVLAETARPVGGTSVLLAAELKEIRRTALPSDRNQERAAPQVMCSQRHDEPQSGDNRQASPHPPGVFVHMRQPPVISLRVRTIEVQTRLAQSRNRQPRSIRLGAPVANASERAQKVHDQR
jgi:hypothetical protein